MLTLLLGADWTENRKAVLDRISQDVAEEKNGRILIVPELISHDMERRLCASAGDTASRFAEVLTFTRLAKRVSDSAGFGAPECLDDGGRLVAMASATRQLHSKLKAYASVETRPEFLTGLLDAVDEFKRCCIGPKDLHAASQRTTGSLAQKLEELSLILEAYNSICAQGKRDPRDQMTWLLEQLEESTFAKEHVFYVDGFPDFTRQHTAILTHLIVNSDNVVVSLTTDSPHADNPAFQKASDTAAELIRLAQQFGVQTEIIHISSDCRPVMQILPSLFYGKTENKSAVLSVSGFESVYQECHAAAERVCQWVENGCRYRDISVVCTDMSEYSNVLDMVFSRYHIPFYQSGTEDILSKTVITTVLSAIDAAVGGFEQSDVLRYLKSPLSPLELSACDMLENYILLWNITGNRWEKDWENHPGGLGCDWTETDKAYLNQLNQLKNSALSPLLRLGKAMKEAGTLAELVNALYDFLNTLQLDARLVALAQELEDHGDFRNSQILSQLWEILLSALEQLSAMLGDTYWDEKTFTKLLKLLLSQYDVGTIPATLDSVMFGPVSAMRCQHPKHLLILGANEGSFPSYSRAAGVLSDQERTALRKLGVPLTGGALEGVQAELAEIYGVFCGAEDTICVFYNGGQPSFLCRRLMAMADGKIYDKPLGIAMDSMEIGAFLARDGKKEDAALLGITNEYEHLLQQRMHRIGRISDEAVHKLYGSNLRLSASQVDKLADCRFAYFLKYGLRLKERKPATIDPAEFGTYLHAVLENTGRKIMELGGFHKVTLEDALKISNEFSKEYIAQRFSQIDSQRIAYLFQRNAQELELVVTELWQELQNSAFEPTEFELPFDGIPVSGKLMTASLRGFVDRVDVWHQNGQAFYRVVDYKTGKKDFDYCDVFNGLGLQMLLYLFALEDRGESWLGDQPVPAGVQYFPARVPVVSLDGRPDNQEAVDARDKLWKRKGLLLAEDAVLEAMEYDGDFGRLPITRKKDGNISGDIANRRQLQLLKGYVFALLGKMVDDISSGEVAPNPYTRGGRHNACAFCPYGAICHESTVEGRRDYAAMNAQKFWEEIEKEMSSRG